MIQVSTFIHDNSLDSKTDTRFFIHCSQRHTKGESLFNKVCDHLSIEEKEFFGLRYIDEKDGQVSTINKLNIFLHLNIYLKC